MAKLARRDFLKKVSGAGVLGAMALAVGESKRMSKDAASALEAVDEHYLSGAEMALGAQEEYRKGLGVKYRNEPKFEVKSWYKRFNSTGIMGNMRDWYYTNRDKANVSQEFYNRMAAEEQLQQITIAGNRQMRGERAAEKYGQPGWTLLDEALRGATRIISSPLTYPATPGMGVPEDIRWGTEINQPARGLQSWRPLTRPTYLSANDGVKYHVDDKKEMSHIIKKVTMLFGGDLVGITHLDRRWVWTHWYDYVYTHQGYPLYFTDEPGCPTDGSGMAYTEPTILDNGTQIVPEGMEYEVMVAVQEHVDFYRSTPQPFYSADNVRAYSRGATLISMMATFIRNLGYNAIPFQNDTASKIPSCIEAGIGEMTQYFCSSPEFGTLQRLFGVITDLPMEPDRPIDFGMREFCADCRKCSAACPGNALSNDPELTDGSERNDVKGPCDVVSSPGKVIWHSNRLRCDQGSSAIGSGCAICKRVCPWNQRSTEWHDRAKWMAVNMGGVGRSALISLYDAFGYGKEYPATEWWNSPPKGISGLSSQKRRN